MALQVLKTDQGTKRKNKEHKQNRVGIKDVSASITVTDFHIVPIDIFRFVDVANLQIYIV
jgi:hypothetical protein